MQRIRVTVLTVIVAFLLITVSACSFFTAPRAAFTASPDGGRAPLLVSFDASSSFAPEGEIEEYRWRFGDGSTAKGKTTEHTYTIAGNYTAVLEVEDNSGATGSASRAIHVTAAPGIFAISVAAYGVCTAGNVCCEPEAAVGPPDAPLGGAATRDFHVSLGADDGYITALMSARFADGPGPDLRVYEVGSLQGGINERFDVWISRNSVTWEQVASSIRNDSGRIYASIDIAGHTSGFSWVKVVNRGRDTSTTPGADIDAIEALYMGEQQGKFQIASTVKVTGTDGAALHVRDAAGGAILSIVPDGWVFEILEGPQTAKLNGTTYNWWFVRDGQYAPAGMSGWVAERYLEEVSRTDLAPHEQWITYIDGQVSAIDATARARQYVEAETEFYDYANKVTRCLGFVRESYDSNYGWISARAALDALTSRGLFHAAAESWNPPIGALVFFESNVNPQYDHVGLFLGSREVAHVEGDHKAHIRDLGEIVGYSYIDEYLGWAYPPDEWLQTSDPIAGSCAVGKR